MRWILVMAMAMAMMSGCAPTDGLEVGRVDWDDCQTGAFRGLGVDQYEGRLSLYQQDTVECGLLPGTCFNDRTTWVIEEAHGSRYWVEVEGETEDGEACTSSFGLRPSRDRKGPGSGFSGGFGAGSF